jgi:hypothetical protein
MNLLRSCARYLALALPDFEIRWGEGEDFSRPFARLTPATGVSSEAIGSFNVERRQTISILVFPTLGINAESSLIEAGRVERLILAAVAQGIDQTGWREGRGHPLRIPLYDYSTVALRAGATEAERIGWARVIESPEVETVADPSESGAVVVVCDLRLAWVESVAVPIDGELIQHVRARAS